MPKVLDRGEDHSLPIAAVTERHRTDLEAIGWTVILLSDHNGGSLCLHAIEDGEVAKLPTLMLAYHPIRCTMNLIEPARFERTDVRRLPKPWEVLARRGGQSGKWADEGPAVETFLRQAATYP